MMKPGKRKVNDEYRNKGESTCSDSSLRNSMRTGTMETATSGNWKEERE